MKIFISAILSATLLFSLSACSSSGGSSGGATSQTDNTNNNTGSSSNTKSNNASSNNSTLSSPDSPSTNSSSNNKVTNETFYGKWTIKQIIASNQSSKTYSNADIKALEGKQLTFTNDSATCFGDKISDINNTVSNPVYKKIAVSQNQFKADTGASFDLFGFKGSSITKVEVTGTKGICTVFYIRPDNNNLLLYGGGDLFELQRANQTIPKSNATNRPSGAWVDAFEKKLYEGYHVTPSRYKNIGNGNWEVWVNEVNTGKNPYVTVNQNTGDFHG